MAIIRPKNDQKSFLYFEVLNIMCNFASQTIKFIYEQENNCCNGRFSDFTFRMRQPV